MADFSQFQLFVVVSVIFVVITFYRHSLRSKKGSIEATSLAEAQYCVPVQRNDDRERKNFADLMRKNHKKLIFFYGSQTGTSEYYATRLAKEAKARYGLSSLVCDPQEYDFNVLDEVPADALAVFIISTYGDGEPTENAVELINSFKNDTLEFSQGGSALSNLQYAIFCIGNSAYENFNTIGKMLDARLQFFGATRIGYCGVGDEDKALEEDYISWKQNLWSATESSMGWKDGAGVFAADFEIKPSPGIAAEKVYQGELSEQALTDSRGVFDIKNPFLSRILETKDLYCDTERNCVFAEFDIMDSRMTYEPGDHVGIWPVNSESDVDRLLRILNLHLRRDEVVDVVSLDPGLAKVPFPVPTTYASIFRHYIDISQLTPRHTLEGFVKFGPTEEAKAWLSKVSTEKDYYHTEIAEKGLNLGEILLTATNESLDPSNDSVSHWNIPFERIISATPRLQPRYYSICSSPRLYPNSIHVAAVVAKDYPKSGSKVVYGLTTNYLLNLKIAINREEPREDPARPTHHLEGPRNKHKTAGTYAVPIHTHLSKFRLPSSVKLPVVMIGPGTGIAPFRGFIQDRVALARRAKAMRGPAALDDWGMMDLFYGCRRSDTDFLFRDEWAGYMKELDGKLRLHVALSRELGQRKVYVQDLIEKEAVIICDSLIKKKGHVYICGDAKNMAHGVEAALERVLGMGIGGEHEAGAEHLKMLKDRRRMALDVW